MSASTFGFEEIEFKHLLPRIGLAFLGANVSLFLADYAIKASNALVSGVISATGGLNHAWISNAVTISSITNGTAPFIIFDLSVDFLDCGDCVTSYVHQSLDCNFAWCGSFSLYFSTLSHS
jgi:hypothetical protein